MPKTAPAADEPGTANPAAEPAPARATRPNALAFLGLGLSVLAALVTVLYFTDLTTYRTAGMFAVPLTTLGTACSAIALLFGKTYGGRRWSWPGTVLGIAVLAVWSLHTMSL